MRQRWEGRREREKEIDREGASEERESERASETRQVHHRADAGASVVAAVGIGGALAGYSFMDPLAGGLV